MKMTINQLIANDIINVGMNKTMSDNYIVELDRYLEDFDDDSKKYILENLEDICDSIRDNESVSDLEYDDNSKAFDMIFYWDNLFDAVDHYIFDLLKEKGLSDRVELEEVKEIAWDFMNDEATRNLANKTIDRNHIRGYEI